MTIESIGIKVPMSHTYTGVVYIPGRKQGWVAYYKGEILRFSVERAGADAALQLVADLRQRTQP